jgi:hypothetical protein
VSKHLPGVSNITGEGLIRSSLRIEGEAPLSQLEQLTLLSKVDANFLRTDIVNTFFDEVVASTTDPNVLKKISKLVGKIPKRLQSELAPRDIGLEIGQLDEVFGRMGVSLGDSLDLTNITEIVLKMARGDVLTGTEAAVAKTIGKRADAMQLIARVSGLIGADPSEVLDPYDVYSLLSEQIRNLSSSATSPNMFEQLKQTIDIVKTAAGTEPDRLRQALEYERVVSSLADNLEPIRDGAVVMTETFAQNLINTKVKEFKRLSEIIRSSGPGSVTEEQLDLLRSLEAEITKLRGALRSGTTSDNTIRFGLGEEVTLPDGTKIGGTIKAKTGVLRFEDYEGSQRFDFKASKKIRSKSKKIKI